MDQAKDEETLLQERDDRVEARLRSIIDAERHEARKLRNMARACERKAQMVEDAVQAEEWWRLRGLIGDDDIESLSECSPTDLFGQRDDGPELIDDGIFDEY